ncbi:MAG: glycosyltransferase family 39 protein, partial [Acidobacteriia bacterium]|nr:glycosyltransferase family 39 protein [Terriglobia bacterium]
MNTRVSGLHSAEAGFDLASKAFLVILAVVILATFKHYGITWDEPIQHFYGRMVGRYYFALLHGQYDTNVLTFELTKYYGGLFDTLAALASYISPFRLYETRHLLNALVGFLGIIGCWRVARLVGGPQAGFWAVLLICLTPRYYGSMFNNPKDIPFATGYVWSLYYLLRIVPELPSVPRKLTVKLGMAIGLTLAVRIGGLLLLCYLALVIGVWGASRARSWRVWGQLARFGSGVTAIAWGIMLIWCPWAHTSPLAAPFRALANFTHDYPWYGSILFDNQIIKAAKEPRTYLLRWFSITLPEVVLVLLAVGLIIAL